jgi:hypothetical protein
MKTKKIIGTGVLIWLVGVSLFTLSYYIPLLEDAEKQANAVLFISVPVLVWFGAKRYFKDGLNTSGFRVGLGFFLTSMTLDALITVPLLIIPNGGSYHQFYADMGFWLIGLEFLLVAMLYGKINISSKNNLNTNHKIQTS